MRIVDRALAKAAELNRQEAENEKQQHQLESMRYIANKPLYELVNTTLNEFDGVKGLIRKGNSLLQRDGYKDVKRAEIKVQYDHPNEDAMIIHWIIYNHDGNVWWSGNDLDSFGDHMAPYMK